MKRAIVKPLRAARENFDTNSSWRGAIDTCSHPVKIAIKTGDQLGISDTL